MHMKGTKGKKLEKSTPLNGDSDQMKENKAKKKLHIFSKKAVTFHVATDSSIWYNQLIPTTHLWHSSSWYQGDGITGFKVGLGTQPKKVDKALEYLRTDDD